MCETGRQVPFQIQRLFWIYNTPANTVRGNHAHREGWQAHICLNGSASIKLDDGQSKEEVLLDSPSSGLVIGPMVWHSFSLSPGATLFVMTSNLYDERDYIRNYEEFLRLVR